MEPDISGATSRELSSNIGGEASDANTYADLFAAIAEQRQRIAFFERVVFHAHSIDSHDWAQRPNADAERNNEQRLRTDAGVSEFLDELARNYRVVCITDHMRSEYACRLAKAALARDDITVLPGVEISCQAPPSYGDCIHLLAVFPPEADSGCDRAGLCWSAARWTVTAHGQGNGAVRGLAGATRPHPQRR
jgi:hypothetical protein